MKLSSYLFLSGAAVALTSCGVLNSVNQPLNTGGGFDPLDGPGSQGSSDSLNALPSSLSYTPGEWVETSMPNTTFFRAIPKGNATADRVISAGVPLKYISTQGSYIKVELESGDVGFVPEIMVTSKPSASEVPLMPSGEQDPSLEGFVPVDSLPTGDLPVTPPETPGAPTLPEVPPANLENPEAPAPPKVEGITEPTTTD